MAIRKINAELVYKDENEHGEPEYGNRITFAVNSADEKPSGELTNGSVCIEVDTGEIFLWDEEQDDWVEQFSVKSEGGGGGNPNQEMTLYGTVDAPFGSMTSAEIGELFNQLDDRNMNAIIRIDASAIGFGTFSQALRIVNSRFETNGADTNGTANIVQWDSTGQLILAKAFVGGVEQDMTPHASIISNALYIFYHPMP